MKVGATEHGQTLGSWGANRSDSEDEHPVPSRKWDRGHANQLVLIAHPDMERGVVGVEHPFPPVVGFALSKLGRISQYSSCQCHFAVMRSWGQKVIFAIYFEKMCTILKGVCKNTPMTHMSLSLFMLASIRHQHVSTIPILLSIIFACLLHLNGKLRLLFSVPCVLPPPTHSVSQAQNSWQKSGEVSFSVTRRGGGSPNNPRWPRSVS